MATSTQNTGSTSHRGFAAMDEERQREIASMGGKAAHASGRAHEFTPEEAREAGRKGGEASHGGHGGQTAKSGGGRSSEEGEGRGVQSAGGQSAGGQSAGGQQAGSSHRGFAAMDEGKQREIASMGGKAAHASGHAHEFTPEEAREAGRKGGEASHGGQAMRTGGNQPGTGRGSGTHFAGTQGGADKSGAVNRR